MWKVQLPSRLWASAKAVNNLISVSLPVLVSHCKLLCQGLNISPFAPPAE